MCVSIKRAGKLIVSDHCMDNIVIAVLYCVNRRGQLAICIVIEV